jgi:hypothetical protein
MLFHGGELREMLSRNSNSLELRNEHGRVIRMFSASQAMALDPNLFIGVGNIRRLRFLRFCTDRYQLNGGSVTTRRMTDGFGMHIAHPLIREHRPSRCK